MTKLAVAVKMDDDGNATVEFDEAPLLRPSIKALMKEVAATLGAAIDSESDVDAPERDVPSDDPLVHDDGDKGC
jgi:hypothetical protein